MRRLIAAIAALVIGAVALAQHQHGSPYSSSEKRSIKGLSDDQIADLRAGRGMGLALPAELNGYPGPAHVIELADELALTSEVRQNMRELFDAMKSEAVPLGESLIACEAALDRAFVDHTISPQTLSTLTAQIGEIQGRLRATHLKYHLAAAELLSPDQRQRYADLRGYH